MVVRNFLDVVLLVSLSCKQMWKKTLYVSIPVTIWYGGCVRHMNFNILLFSCLPQDNSFAGAPISLETMVPCCVIH